MRPGREGNIADDVAAYSDVTRDTHAQASRPGDVAEVVDSDGRGLWTGVELGAETAQGEQRLHESQRLKTDSHTGVDNKAIGVIITLYKI